MSFGDQPKAPDPTATSQTQQQYNIGAGTAQQNLNMVDQSNPLGSLRYTQTGTNPDGTPKFSASTTYSQPVQSIFDQYLKTQGTTGQTAGNLATSSAGMYSQPPNINGDSTFKQLQGWQQAYVQPIFDRQRGTLDAKLQAQGILPGSEAYARAQNVQARNEGDVNNQFFSTAQPLAYNQAVTSYQLPLQTLTQLQGLSQPTSPNFQATPTAQVQPANYAGAVQNNYNAQLQQYQNQQAGMWGLAGAGLNAAGRFAGSPAGSAALAGLFL
jgi:hypothetical protein